MFMKGRLETKAQIYGIYWKYEKMLALVWKIISENIDEEAEKKYALLKQA